MPAGERGCLQHKQGQFALPGAEEQYAPDLALAPVHVELDLQLDLEGRTLGGVATTRVLANADRVRRLRLDAVAFDEVAIDQPEIEWRYDGRQIDLVWQRAFEEGEEREVTVRYRVERPVTGLQFSVPDAAYPARPLFAVTDHETERARYWLPCVDYPNVRTSFDTRLTAAADLTILAGGTLVEDRDNGDGTHTARWVLDHPCPSYIYCFAVGRFVQVVDETVDGIEIVYFGAQGERTEDLTRSFGRTPEMLRWLRGRLEADFPFPKYYQIALPDICGAMENISLTTWDQRYVLDERLAAEDGHVVDSINIHELAHSYFGDAVVIRDFASAWLKESWATYIECCWLEHRHGPDELGYDLYRNAELYFEEVKQKYVRPIVTRCFNSSWDMYDRHLYPGGAWRIHMLRRELGEEAFWAATADYVDSFSRGLVETSDFVRKLEAHCGRNLGAFFDQWIFGLGYPALEVTFEHDPEAGEGTLMVTQTQVCDERGVGLFRFELTVAFEGQDGSWERVRLPISSARHQQVLPMARPRQLCVDPDDALLLELTLSVGDDLLCAALTDSPTVRGRILAARKLARSGKRASCRAILEAFRSEPFWGVRCELARELGASGATEAIEPLAAMLLEEADPRVQLELAAACGRLRDPRLGEALARLLGRPGLPYRTHAAALASLGAQRDPRYLQQLLTAADDEGWRSMVRAGALQGLGRTGDRRAFELLLSRVAYGVEPEPARTAAVAALAEAASWQDGPLRDRAVGALVDLTRDPHPLVQLAAAQGLADLRAPEGVPALQALERVVAEQERPRLARHLATIRKGRDPGAEAVALRKTVEELRQQLHDLEGRLQKLESSRPVDVGHG